MSIAKVIEVIAEGDSVESAIEAAARDAHESLRNIRQVDVKHIEALVKDDGSIKAYRVNANVSFVVED